MIILLLLLTDVSKIETTFTIKLRLTVKLTLKFKCFILQILHTDSEFFPRFLCLKMWPKKKDSDRKWKDDRNKSVCPSVGLRQIATWTWMKRF